jgi:PucR C-terminal helix-turn-helix domain/GGDEF-like domain
VEATLHGDWPTLERVIGSLDSEVLQVLCAPDPAIRVSDVVILDPSDPRSVSAGAIVLGIGTGGSDRDTLALVERAARSGAAAVVFRTPGELPGGALDLGVAVLAVPPVMPWGQVYSLLRTALASAGAPGEADAAGVALGDLFALADAVAASVGGPVTIEDPQFRVLAFSNLGHEIDEARRQTILGRGVPAAWQKRLEDAGVPQALRSGDEVVRFADDGGDVAPRLAAPVRAGGELLGAVWVAEAGAPLGDDAEAALARAAQVAAIHLIAHRASDDLKRRARGAFVREVLAGRVPRGAAADAPLRSTGPFTVLVFRPEDGPPQADPERILSVVSLYCEDAHRDAMCALVDERFWALLPTPGRGAREKTRELAARIVERVESAIGVRLAAGIGVTVGQVADVPRSRRAAEQALTVLLRRGGEVRVADIEEVRAHAVLLELLGLAEEHASLLPGKVEALLAHDREHGTRHAGALRAYLDCWGDMAEAARRAGVHVNTMRYRVRKVIEVAGLDLRDPEERLVTELQLRLHEHVVGSPN